MDQNKMPAPEAALINARLYLHRGKRWMQTGVTAAAIVALYNSVLYGMHYYIARHKRCAAFMEKTDLWDAIALYHALARAGVFDDPHTFNRFSRIVERALWRGSSLADSSVTLTEVEKLLTKLGVIPLDESLLPRGPSS